MCVCERTSVSVCMSACLGMLLTVWVDLIKCLWLSRSLILELSVQQALPQAGPMLSCHEHQHNYQRPAVCSVRSTPRHATPAVISLHSTTGAHQRPACPPVPLPLLKDIATQTWRRREAEGGGDRGGIGNKGERGVCLYTSGLSSKMTPWCQRRAE